jgi:hypothetical protein
LPPLNFTPLSAVASVWAFKKVGPIFIYLFAERFFHAGIFQTKYRHEVLKK